MKKVLIVEDDQFLLDAYKSKFSHVKGMEVEFARDGKEAIEKIGASKPDGIILDLVMPYMDGFSVLKAMKQEKLNIPVLVASNLDSKEDIELAMDLGAKDYFIKSNTSIQDIVQKVANMMEKKD